MRLNQIFPTVFTLLFTCALQAQPVIGPDDMPAANASYQLYQAAGIGLEDPALDFGENVTWDYSALDGMGPQVTDFLPVSSAPFFYQFVFNNPNQQHYANHCTAVPEFGLPLPIEISQIYNFFRADEQGYYDCGFAATLSGFPLFANRNPTDRILKFPLEYGMEPDTNDTFFSAGVPGFGELKSFRIRQNSVDGWGTVITPAGSFDCLRVRSVVSGRDTLFAEEFGIDQVIELPETIEYRWVAPEGGPPVLQINMSGGAVTQVSYRGLDVTSVPEWTKVEKLSVYPNPAVSHTWLELPEDEQVLQIIAFDSGGRTVQIPVAERQHNRMSLNTGSLAAGNYQLGIQTHKNWYSATVMVVR